MTTETLSVSILDKEYQVACPAEEKKALLDAASELDKRMRDIRQSGGVIGIERIAIMAALNLANDLLSTSTSENQLDQNLLNRLYIRLDSALK